MDSPDRRFWIYALGSLALVTLVLGWGVNRYYIQQQIAQTEERLMLLSTLRREALERYLDTAEAELRFWSKNEELLESQKYFKDRWQEYAAAGGDPEQTLRQLYIQQNPYPPGQRRDFHDAGDGSTYSALHAALHPTAKLFVTERSYYDFFLIDPSGNIGYTVEKEDDYGTNLVTGPWKDSGLGKVFSAALAGADAELAVFSDLQRYGPSDDAPALFMAKATHGLDGELLGVIAFQLPTDRITEIMRFDAGMGDSGETYLVGRDLLMRSNSRFSEESTILSTTVDTATVHKALAGETGVEFTPDYRGVEVLSAYSMMDSHGISWAVMAEIDRAEVLQNATSERPWLAGTMLLFFSLTAWSAWYLRGAEAGADSMFVDVDLDGGMDVGDG